MQWLVTDPHCWQPQQQSAETVITGYALLHDSQPNRITIFQSRLRANGWYVPAAIARPRPGRPGSADYLQAWAEARNAWFRAQQYMYFATDRSSGAGEPLIPEFVAHWRTIAAPQLRVQSPLALEAARQPRAR